MEYDSKIVGRIKLQITLSVIRNQNSLFCEEMVARGS